MAVYDINGLKKSVNDLKEQNEKLTNELTTARQVIEIKAKKIEELEARIKVLEEAAKDTNKKTFTKKQEDEE